MFDEDDLMEQTSPEEESTEQTSSEATDDSATAATEQQSSETAEVKDILKYTVRGVEYEIDRSEIDVATIQKGKDYDHVRADLETQRKTSMEATTSLERLTGILNQLGYVGSPQEIADALEAQRREIEPEQVRREREAEEAQERAKQEAEVAKMEADSIRREAVFARDLLEIQKLNPNVKSLQELGDTFFRLRAAGLSNLEAYELTARPKQGKKPPQGGKEHLITTDGGSTPGGPVDIPKGELDFWRESFPDDTPAKLKERYNRARKRQGE